MTSKRFTHASPETILVSREAMSQLFHGGPGSVKPIVTIPSDGAGAASSKSNSTAGNQGPRQRPACNIPSWY